MSLGTDIINVMTRAAEKDIEVSEITLSEAQHGKLADEYAARFWQKTRPSETVAIFNGARIVVRPDKAKTLAEQLRTLATQVENMK